MRTPKSTLVPVLLLGLLYGCGGSQPNLKAREYRGKFQDQQAGLSFVAPERWEVRENIEGYRVIARSPLENRQDTFQENLVVKGPLPAKEVAAAMEQARTDAAQLDKFQLLESSNPNVLLYQYEIKGRALESRAHFLPNPQGGVWMLLFTSTAQDFERWRTEFDNIAATFGQPIPEPTTSPTPAASATPEPAATPTVSPTDYTPAATLTAPATDYTPATPSAAPTSTASPAAPVSPSPTATPHSGTASPTPRP